MCCNPSRSVFPFILRPFLSIPSPLGAELFEARNNGSANAFYIVSGQIPPCSVYNLNSAETHKNAYGPLQLRPVYTFLPEGALLFQAQNTPYQLCAASASFLYTITTYTLIYTTSYIKTSKGRICLKTFRASKFIINRAFF